ncbi:chromosomal replication initiator protein DnaA [Arenimonas maotaiensis]|uniref:Chromosomal replication initiator protein DnaA n=1 Tax=Arenimonas maotaiensis TaxID=1446479 RepID=A0A917CNR6_9GAMM|nr:chromosomal replication initiator protein DnaA [Arenimonas maotaiensis]MCC6757690.1 chromosomal replication initiator protein DnaA [Arenimonas sp.]GGF94563.1 chromosomal replication initiator protein DnaA [Arenimonas maotaiensis]
MNVWPQCLARLEQEFPAEDVHTWLKPLHASRNSDELHLYAPNAFVVEQVQSQYLPRIEELARHFAGGPLAVKIAVGSHQKSAPAAKPAAKKAAAAAAEFQGNVDPHYTFDNFVVGKCNQMGHAMALQVAKNPGKAYNPLLLYGSTGLGKTHLMYAAGNYMRAHNPGMRVLYMRSEQFFNAMIKALTDKNMAQFKKQFQQVDALLIDDIQFFAGKNTTQEEFFHTFNTLVDGKQQIILTCDRYPREVENLEPRLKSRLGWGLSVVLEPPDDETRATILMDKAQRRGIALPTDVAWQIAKRLHSSVRDLEGALNTLAARANFTGNAITLDFAQETLRDLMRAQASVISLSNIQKTVADYYQLKLTDLLSQRRTRSLARPRQVAMALAKELTEHSLPEIGEAFGGRDHTTVLHGCRVIQGLRESDGKIREDWDKLVRKLTE